MNPTDLKYYTDHSWIRLDGRRATLGITDYAQEALGDVVYIELPKVGRVVTPDTEIGELESTKTTAPLITPLSGRIIEVNEALKTSPELLNKDPYGRGWVAVLELSEPHEASRLLDAAQYEALLTQATGEA